MAKASYSKPTSQLDLEARQKADYVPPGVVKKSEDQGLSDNGYIGVDPIYQNHANDTEAPIQSEKGPEAKIFNNHYTDDVDFGSTGSEEGFDAGWSAADAEVPDDDEDESEDEEESPNPPEGQTPPGQ